MKTTVVNIRRENYQIYIGRPSKWGNPFSIGRDGTREEVIKKYTHYLDEKLQQEPYFLEPLRGKVLGCYCKSLACHGDIIVKKLEGDDEI